MNAEEQQYRDQLTRENRRRTELVRARRDGLASNDPAERAKWQARDEALTRRIGRLP